MLKINWVKIPTKQDEILNLEMPELRFVYFFSQGVILIIIY